MIYVLDGEINVNGENIGPYQLGKTSPIDLEIEAQISTQALILAGIPLNEPVVFGGPFVMNTEEEIQKAHINFRAGKFGEI